MRKWPVLLVIVGIVAIVGMVLMAVGRARQQGELEAWEADEVGDGIGA